MCTPGHVCNLVRIRPQVEICPRVPRSKQIRRADPNSTTPPPPQDRASRERHVPVLGTSTVDASGPSQVRCNPHVWNWSQVDKPLARWTVGQYAAGCHSPLVNPFHPRSLPPLPLVRGHQPLLSLFLLWPRRLVRRPPRSPTTSPLWPPLFLVRGTTQVESFLGLASVVT